MVIITEQGEWKPTQEEIIAMALGIDPRKERETKETGAKKAKECVL